MNLKENAKQPKRDGINWRCPNCDNYVHDYDAPDLESNDAVRYCHMCGQKMDLGVIAEELKVRIPKVIERTYDSTYYGVDPRGSGMYKYAMKQETNLQSFLYSALGTENIEVYVSFNIWMPMGHCRIRTQRKGDYWTFLKKQDVEAFMEVKDRLVKGVDAVKGYGYADYDVMVERTPDGR